MKRRDEVMVGLTLLFAVVLGLGGTIWVARGGLSRGYPMYARFPWGAGLKTGQAVLLAGVQVGFVDKVELVPDGTLAVTMQVNKEYQVPTGSEAAVDANGIFGDQLIAITAPKGVTTYMAAGDTIKAGKGAPRTGELLTKGDSIATDIRALTGRFRSEYVEGGGMADTRQTIKDLTKLMAQMSTVVADQNKQLTITQQALRRTIASVDSAKVDSTVVNLRTTSANLEKLSRSLDSTRVAVNSVVAKVNSGPGTVGKFMNDPAVYARVDTLLLRLDSITLDFKKNPRRYINLKIF